MGDNSKIEWTEATFNPWWGCAKVSPGCDHCYAERDAERYQPRRELWGVDADRREFGEHHWNEPRRLNRRAEREGRRIKVFCASMADVFDKNAPIGARGRLWALIQDTPFLDWQLLTKRIGNAPAMLPDDWGDGYPNAWLGISVVNQAEAERDIPKLLRIPARIRFLSCEPLLGPIKLGKPGESWLTWLPRGSDSHALPPIARREAGIDWVIAGGESGPKARPSHPEWFRELRDQCQAAGVPFFFKQWGEWAPSWCSEDGPRVKEHEWPDNRWSFRVGKKAAGRLLDGRTWDEYPNAKGG